MSRSDMTYTVSIAKVRDDRIDRAVEEALDLLGGLNEIAQEKQCVLLKPNMVIPYPQATTKPAVVRALARLMLAAGKVVTIGEGPAVAAGINILGQETYRTKNPEILARLERHVFDCLGYTSLAEELGVPLVGLNTGRMVEVPVEDGYVYDRISLHHAVAETDLLCSVPVMKTHCLSTVTLGMKNLIGLYPGAVYATARSEVHEHAFQAGSPGMAFETVDIVKASRPGLVVVDGTTAMEGNGPIGGPLVEMGLIIAGTNALATDMVAARLMGFMPEEVPTFIYAQKAGLGPNNLDEIKVRGERIEKVERKFTRPRINPWPVAHHRFGEKELP